MAREATAQACANIAFIKYWGNLSRPDRLPYNDSLSMNLSEATSTTTVRFVDGLDADRVTVDGSPLHPDGVVRASSHLDHVRSLAGIELRADVTSTNTFPMGTGIASSASGFAALTVAATAAAGVTLDERQMSCLARLGSGSASRSVPAGFVEWRAAPTHDASYARSIAGPDHWDLRDIVAVVSHAHKTIGSGGGHDAASTSLHFEARLAALRARLPRVRDALLARDFERFGSAVEAEALSMHAIALTSDPPILYWEPGTIALLKQATRWRQDGLPVYATLDAGPNVHLLVEGDHADALEGELGALDYVASWLHNRAGGAARLVEDRT